MKMFVYGTLKSGYSNNGYMRNCTLIGKVKTKDKFSLYSRGIPYLGKEPNYQVIGELYEVPKSELPAIDRLEGYRANDHQGSWYKREDVIVVDEEGNEHQAQSYFNEEKGELIGNEY